jgi:hypothetical protein
MLHALGAGSLICVFCVICGSNFLPTGRCAIRSRLRLRGPVIKIDPEAVGRDGWSTRGGLRIEDVSTEADRTGQRSAQVRDNTGALNEVVGELKASVIRVVRTSAAEVDRRLHRRHKLDAACVVTTTGAATGNGRVVDISQSGAGITGIGAPPLDTKGTLRVDGIAMTVPFTVRTCDDRAVGVA